MIEASRSIREETGSRETPKSPTRARLSTRIMREKSGFVGALILTTIVLATVFAPWLAPYPDQGIGMTDIGARLKAPNGAYWFGTDNLGRDVFSRVLFGGRISLTIAVIAVFASSIVGTTLGLLSGYFGNWVDEVTMRVADVFLGLPALVIAVLVAFAFGGGLIWTIPAIAIPWWPAYARLVRSEVLRLKSADFVLAARAVGAPDRRIVWRHVSPNTLPAVIVQASLQMGQAILVAASLSFIGLGAKPPSPEWGLSVAVGREFIPDAWWISFFPGLAIMLVVIGLNLFGDALRFALDPQSTSARGLRRS